ncbi:hypothetical protein BRARA_D01094 [Brassica rapa]|uniref:Uncharacterized protein n=1 Tax=Brassica campestris TaxID=3711 RepID=A0A397ZNK0_BRACM|nr:hypothetical protein BRARA_D01094 [Brassica rapa]
MIMEHDKDLILEDIALNKKPKLYNGLKFYIIGYFKLAYKGYLQDIVAGGTMEVIHFY